MLRAFRHARLSAIYWNNNAKFNNRVIVTGTKNSRQFFVIFFLFISVRSVEKFVSFCTQSEISRQHTANTFDWSVRWTEAGHHCKPRRLTILELGKECQRNRQYLMSSCENVTDDIYYLWVCDILLHILVRQMAITRACH